MPLDPVTVPQYPNVPPSPGVPPLAQQPGATPPAPIQPVSGDAPSLAAQAPRWGIFNTKGQPVITADATQRVEFKGPSVISTAPQEEGAFLSYNKVQMPFAGIIRMFQGGTDDDRANFLQSVAIAKISLDRYVLAMPEVVYKSINVVDYAFDRSPKTSLELLSIDIKFEEVRVTGTTEYTTTKTPSGADSTTTGGVQPTTPTPGQQKTISDSAASAPGAGTRGGITDANILT